jgi:radical SAM/Cys-rich protein
MSAVAPLREPPVPQFPPLQRAALTTLQVNLGYRCNQACTHCHVDAGPLRTEQMSDATLALVLAYLRRRRLQILDVTGGAPELHPGFRRLTLSARAEGISVIDRCNLTILEEPGQEDLAQFLAAAQVKVVASLPCYGADNVDRQRGRGVFSRSLRGLRRLNALGYGVPGSGLLLDLVYNPGGPFLPPAQAALEATYRQRLQADHGIVFNRLLTLANMPIARFRRALERDGRYADYLQLLVDNHVPANLANVMCRSLISVDWRGHVHDCDFNQMLGLPLADLPRAPHLSELLDQDLTGNAIAVRPHCHACTAGQGSSCGGALHA